MIRILATISLSLLVAMPAAGGPLDDTTRARRIIAVGDVHGNADGLAEILIETEVISEDHTWIGGDTVLVQTGDLLDRGRQVREAMDLLMALQAEAPQTGGRVVVLLGNHETMNLFGIVRDVNPGVYEDLVDKKSKRRLSSAFRSFKKYWRHHAEKAGQPIPNFDAARDQWDSTHPPGFLEYIASLGPNAEYGTWLRQCPVAVRVDDTVFIHGGPGPMIKGLSIDEINGRAQREIATFDLLRAWCEERGLVLPNASIYEVAQAADAVAGAPDLELPAEIRTAVDLVGDWQQWSVVNSDGPLWFRGASTWPADRSSDLQDLVSGLPCRRIVVGHTPQRTGDITTRFNGSVFLIDTGMASTYYPGGRPSALEITGTSVTAVYLGERRTLWQADDDLPLAAGQ